MDCSHYLATPLSPSIFPNPSLRDTNASTLLSREDHFDNRVASFRALISALAAAAIAVARVEGCFKPDRFCKGVG